MGDDPNREPEPDSGDVDFTEALTALLAISPEDAAKARERAARLAAGTDREDRPGR